MEPGDLFTYLDENGSQVSFRIGSPAELLSFLQEGGELAAFEDLQRRVVGFMRGSAGVALTLQVIKEHRAELYSLLGEFSTPAGRAEIARKFSTTTA